MRNDLAGAFIGDDEGEDGEAEEEDDEEEHDEEIDPEEPWNSATGADEAGEGDDEEEGTNGDDGLLEELLTVCAGAGGEPDAASEDGDGEEEDDEVEKAYEVVAQAEHVRFRYASDEYKQTNVEREGEMKLHKKVPVFTYKYVYIYYRKSQNGRFIFIVYLFM